MINKENVEKLAEWINAHPDYSYDQLKEALQNGANIDDFKAAFAMVRISDVGLRYRGVAIRALAHIIDGIILVGITWLLVKTSSNCNFKSIITDEAEGGLCGFLAGIQYLIMFAYFVILEWKLGGTLGKLMMGIRVVKITGEPLSFKDSLIRNVMRIIDILPFLYVVGVITIWCSKKKQRVGDMLAKTVVVSK